MFFNIFSCIPVRNEYGMPRFNLNRFSLKANIGEENKVENTIDLTSLYKTEKTINTYLNQECVNCGLFYLKFFKNGKVAIFTKDPLFEINPKRSIMGIYQELNGTVYIEYFKHSAQAGDLRVKKKLYNDGVYLRAESSGYTTKYKKISLNSDYTLIEPDW